MPLNRVLWHGKKYMNWILVHSLFHCFWFRWTFQDQGREDIATSNVVPLTRLLSRAAGPGVHQASLKAMGPGVRLPGPATAGRRHALLHSLPTGLLKQPRLRVDHAGLVTGTLTCKRTHALRSKTKHVVAYQKGFSKPHLSRLSHRNVSIGSPSFCCCCCFFLSGSRKSQRWPSHSWWNRGSFLMGA